MKIIHILFIVTLFEISLCYGHKILAIFPNDGKSHHLVLEQVSRSLVAKGHQIDVVSRFPLKENVENYRDIQLTNLEEPFVADYEYIITPASERFDEIRGLLKKFCGYLEHPFLQKLINSKEAKTKYDLVLVHYLVGFQCFSAFGHIWNVPVVGIVTTWPYPEMAGLVEQPLNLALYPSHLNSYQTPVMNFWERLHNVVTTKYNMYQFDVLTDVEQDYYLKKYFGPNIPSHEILEKTATSLMLANSHYSFYGSKPISPALKEIGGIHIKNDTSTLDENLKQFLDQSEHGFIYLSFGTLVRIETFPNEILHKFYEAIRKVSPTRVVVRVPNPEAMPKNWPKNTFVHKWLPQQLLLQHPKIRGFVTHGGAHGIQEGLYYAVPMICVPFFSDQKMNCDIVEMKKLGVQLDFKSARQEDYDRAFQEILSNPVYKEGAKRLSALYRDRPRSPSDEAVYWIEYVIRHGKNVLKSPAVHLKWWQIELLDVYGFIASCVLLTIGAAVFIVRLIFVYLRKMTKSTSNVSNKKFN